MQKNTSPAYSLHARSAFFQSLLELDLEVFKLAKKRPCPWCGGKLDTSHFMRKPRGLGEAEGLRFSLCCRQEGCRKRVTPKSLRFFGRKVYSAWVVILAVDFYDLLGLSGQIARQTIGRWRQLWQSRLSETHPFMRQARADLKPGLGKCKSPLCILPLFGFPEDSSWILILKFFVPTF